MTTRTFSTLAGSLALALLLAGSAPAAPGAPQPAQPAMQSTAKPAAQSTPAEAAAPSQPIVKSITPVKPPPPPKNLKVLPKDCTRQQVIDVMKTWTGDLGVRCQYCHVGQEGLPFSEWDFPSDEKDTKRRAREMVQLLEEVNHRLSAMPSIHGAATPPVATCGTCHRGVWRPRKIEDVFEETRAASGLPAAITQYKDLRKASLANGNYDFSARPLTRQARRQLDAKDIAGARQVMDMAIELGLDNLSVRMTLVDIALADGDRTGALAQLDKAMALPLSEDEKGWVKERRAEIENKPVQH